MIKVYTAGPMTGLTAGVSVRWRDDLRKALSNNPFSVLDPCRDSGLAANDVYSASGCENGNALTVPRAQRARNLLDIQRSDVVFCSLLYASRVSVGTVYELGYAAALNKPTIVVIERTGNVHEHLMLSPGFDFRVDNLSEGLQLLLSCFKF